MKDQLLPTICELSEQAGVPCIDIYSVTKDHPEWFPDKLHPNKDGNVAIAEEILAHIKP